jgi:hypothetical protein
VWLLLMREIRIQSILSGMTVDSIDNVRYVQQNCSCRNTHSTDHEEFLCLVFAPTGRRSSPLPSS